MFFIYRIINLSNFFTSNLNNISYIFSGCSSLKNLDISNFTADKIKLSEDIENPFKGSDNLENVKYNDNILKYKINEHIDNIKNNKK